MKSWDFNHTTGSFDPNPSEVEKILADHSFLHTAYVYFFVLLAVLAIGLALFVFATLYLCIRKTVGKATTALAKDFADVINRYHLID